jgi:hypothetical protein
MPILAIAGSETVLDVRYRARCKQVATPVDPYLAGRRTGGRAASRAGEQRDVQIRSVFEGMIHPRVERTRGGACPVCNRPAKIAGLKDRQALRRG